MNNIIAVISPLLDARHSVAIADMGNYQEVLRQMSPLREVDPGQNRVHMFGNPFKLAKDQVIKGINSLNKSGKIKGLEKNVLGKVLALTVHRLLIFCVMILPILIHINLLTPNRS